MHIGQKCGEVEEAVLCIHMCVLCIYTSLPLAPRSTGWPKQLNTLSGRHHTQEGIVWNVSLWLWTVMQTVQYNYMHYTVHLMTHVNIHENVKNNIQLTFCSRTTVHELHAGISLASCGYYIYIYIVLRYANTQM